MQVHAGAGACQRDPRFVSAERFVVPFDICGQLSGSINTSVERFASSLVAMHVDDLVSQLVLSMTFYLY